MPSTSAPTATEPQDAPSGGPVIVIEPSRGWRSLKLDELWNYRELLVLLAQRDITVRYKQTALGVLWALLQPFVTMLIFTVIFGRVAGLDRHTPIPYAVMTFTALLPWQLFAGALPRISNSLVGSANLITKVYFPRMLIPIAAMGAGLIDFFISFALLAVMILCAPLWAKGWHFVWSPALLTLPLFVVLALLSALAVGLWFSALNVHYRDVTYITPFLVQVWMFVSPVAYPASVISERWHLLYWLNPMAGVIQGFRWALLGDTLPGWPMAVSVAVVLMLLVTGMFFFRSMERYFADVV